MNNSCLPVISVIIPVFNTDMWFFKKCISSILKQSYSNYEVIIVDASTDNNLINFINSITSKKVRVINANKNVSEQRNVGIENARGQYITFVDSDDFVNSNYLQKLLECSIKNKSDVVSPLMKKVIYKNCKKEKEYYFDDIQETIFIDDIAFFDLINNTRIINPIKLYKKSLIGETRFDPNYSYGEDMVFNYALSRKGFVVSHSNEAVYNYNSIHEENAALKHLDFSGLKILTFIKQTFYNYTSSLHEKTLKEIVIKYNFIFLLYLEACTRKKKRLWLFYLNRYKLFYLRKNKKIHNKFYVLFPTLYTFLKRTKKNI